MARRLAASGAEVTAFDFSTSLVELARARGTRQGRQIHFLVTDATDEDAVAAIGEGRFDAVVCTMALMDMPTIVPLYRGVHRLLRADGRFVFVTAHPIFDTANPIRIVEEEDREGRIVRRDALKLERYLDVPATRVMGARGEPTPHEFHHRPLHALLGEAFAAGFVLEAIEEPAFSRRADPDGAMRSWWQFPPALAGRLRKGVRSFDPG